MNGLSLGPRAAVVVGGRAEAGGAEPGHPGEDDRIVIESNKCLTALFSTEHFQTSLLYKMFCRMSMDDVHCHDHISLLHM